MRRAALAAVLLVACERRPAPGIDASPPSIEASTVDASVAGWADFPPTAEAARALVDRFTRRPADGRLAPLDAPTILGRIDAWVERGPAGDGFVDEKLRARFKRSDEARRTSVVLVGAIHDAPAHVEAFRRIVGPSSAVTFDVVAFEQLAADGHWNLVAAPQGGETALVEAWSASGSGASLRAIAESQAKRDYAAWKFGYLEAVTDAMVSARAAGAQVVPCDMPEALQRALGAARESWLLRMRELHCAFTLRDAERRAPAKEARHVAVFFGAAHVGPEGLARTIAPADDVTTVRVVGGRLFVRDLDDGLARRYQLAMPLLVAMDDAGRDHVLLVADPVAQARVETIREADPGTSGPPRIEVVASRAGIAASLRFVGVRDAVVATIGSRQVVALPAGRHVAVLGRAPPFVVFPVDVPASGFTEIALGDRISITVRERR